jgi:ankyrin repeat protein
MRTAVIENNAAKLKALLASGESMNEKDEASGDTLLHLAVRWGSLAAASLLLECGADVNAANGSECTPLHYAAKARAGDESEDEDEDDGWVIPERACRCEQLAELLLASRADVNAVDKSQRTPLHLAIVRKDVHAEALTRRLLQAHADPSYRYKQQTCLHLAVLEANEALVTALFLVAEAATAAGAVAGATDACQQALLDAPGRDGWTALGLAVRCGHVSIVKGLLDLRASPLANARSGKTALEIAVANNRPGILALLVVRGVS